MSKSVQELLREVRNSIPYQGHKAYKRKRKKRQFRGWTWDSYDLNNNMMNNEKIFIGASDFSDYVFSQICDARMKENKPTFSREYQFHCTRKKWHEFMEEEFDGDHIFESGDSSGMILFEDHNLIRYNLNSSSTTITVTGDMPFISEIKELIFANFEEVTSYIEWIYSSDGNSVNVPLNKDRMPISEMYPFLKDETLENYYDRYLNSPANILLLIGPPGTGKTTFIRGLLSHSNSSAIVTYDSAILEKDYLFARFIEDEANIMVLEDSDNFLKARSDGNSMMHRFLNVGDGLVTTKGKKLIFSTNLPSIRDVDSALVRPGRCFDILNFENLNHEQAVKLAEKVGVELNEQRSKWTIAEVFNKKIDVNVAEKVGTKMGFI